MRLATLATTLILISGVSAAATAPNASANVSKVESVCMSGNLTGRIDDIKYSAADNREKVEFTGGIQSSTPCHTVNHTLTREDGKYVLNIETPPESNGPRTPCIQCVGEVMYTAEFEANQPFKLEVRHKGETIRNLTYPENSSENETSNNTGENNNPENIGNNQTDSSTVQLEQNSSTNQTENETGSDLFDGPEIVISESQERGTQTWEEENSSNDSQLEKRLKDIINSTNDSEEKQKQRQPGPTAEDSTADPSEDQDTDNAANETPQGSGLNPETGNKRNPVAEFVRWLTDLLR